MRISDWSSDVCSSDLQAERGARKRQHRGAAIEKRVVESGHSSFLTDFRKPGRRGEAGGHAFEHGAKLRVADVAEAVPQLGGYGFQNCRRLNGRGGGDLAVRHADAGDRGIAEETRSEEHTSELQSLMRHSYDVF